MRTLLVSLLAFSTALASAQVAHPFSVEAGLFLPDYHRFGSDAGVCGALGYTFSERGPWSLMGQVRAACQAILQGGGSDVGTTPPGDLSVLSGFVNARYRPVGKAFFGGVGLGVGQANQVDAADHSGALLAVEGGYDLSRAVYVTVRYETAAAKTLRAGFVGLGYRF